MSSAPSSTHSSVVIDLQSLSQNFPLAPETEISRNSLVSTLRNLVQENVYAVCVEGVEGIGKTTLLSQLARAHSTSTISTFVSAANKLSYDVDLLRGDLAGQIYWLLSGEILKRNNDEPALLKSLYVELQRFAKQKKSQILFVIDGIEELPDGIRNGLIQQLSDVLPIGIPQFRFFFSGDQSIYSNLISSKLLVKSFIVPEFGVSETMSLFEEHSLDMDAANELNILCRGIPGRLASALRALGKGTTAADLLKDAPKKWPEFFEIDWHQVSEDDDALRKILALVAHDARPHSVVDISETLGLTGDEVRGAISRINFLRVSEGEAEVQFASRGLRSFVADKLSDKRQYVLKALVKRFMKSPQLRDSVLELPEYLEEAAEYQELVSLLTPDHILQVLERSQTLARVGDTVKRGFRGAQKLGRDADLLRFGIQRSVVGELASSDVWESEVAALAALHEDEQASTLANNAILREDRLQMLATFAQHIWLRGDDVPTELIDQIRLLIDNVDAWSLGRRASKIASKLTCVSPDLAMGVLKKARNTMSEREVERRLATLTVQALRSVKSDVRRDEVLATAVRSRGDSTAKSVLEGVRLLSGRLTPSEVRERIEEIKQPEAQLTVLRYWCMLNAGVSGADEVAEAALNLALSTPTSMVDASLLADIAAVVPATTVLDRRKILVASLDGLRGTAERLGPSVDYVRLQLSLALAQIDIDAGNAEGRLVEIFDYVMQISDLPSKGQALGQMLGTLRTASTRLIMPTLQARCASELEAVVLTLSESTADQYMALGGIITGLATGDLPRALDYVRIVNTEQRRDAILNDIVEQLIRQSVADIDPEEMQKVVDGIESPDVREDALVMLVQRMAEDVLTAEQMKSLLPLLNRLPDLRNSVHACRGLVHALIILGKSSTGLASLEKHFMDSLLRRWRAIDAAWVRIDAGFGIATDLAPTRPEAAKEILNESEKLKADCKIAAPHQAGTFGSCVRMVIRIFCGLLPRHLETDEDINAIAALIDVLSSYGERAALWADLCLRAILAERSDLAEKIMKGKVMPLLTFLSKEDQWYNERVIMQVAPALFKTNSTICLEEIDKLSLDYRDLTLIEIIEFLVYKRVPYEASGSQDGPTGETSYDVLRQVESLAARLETDWMLFLATKWVAECLQSPANKYTINTPQREDLGQRFAQLANTKLPTVRHITHDGFRLATLAQAYRMSQNKPAAWDDLIRQTEALSNVADRVYVLQIVALCLPKSQWSVKEELLKKAHSQISDIPWQFDQVERCIALAEDLKGVDTGLCRGLISRASHSITGNSEDAIKQRRKVVDVAFRVDEDFAQKIIEAFDDDVAKRRARDQIRLLEVRKAIGEGEGKPDEEKVIKQVRGNEVSKLGTMLAQSLRAGRIQSYRPSDIRDYLELAAEQPLNRAQPMLTWYLDNAVTRFASTDQAATFLRPMFDGCVIGAQLAAQISGKALIRLRALKSQSSELASEKSFLASPQSRDEAIQFTRSWLERRIGDEVLIHDPYFSPSELAWLQIIRTVRNDCRITVMTARKNQPPLPAGKEFEDVYSAAWRSLYDQSPPTAEIIVIGGETSKDSPIHDRWLLTGGVGLRFGTSLNSLGVTKDSEISELNATEAQQKLLLLMAYISREKTEHLGERLRMTRFWL